jgi:hypothetical protein
VARRPAVGRDPDATRDRRQGGRQAQVTPDPHLPGTPAVGFGQRRTRRGPQGGQVIAALASQQAAQGLFQLLHRVRVGHPEPAGHVAGVSPRRLPQRHLLQEEASTISRIAEGG